MIKLLLILLILVVTAHIVASLFRGRAQRTLGNAEVNRGNSNRDNAIDAEYTEIFEADDAGSPPPS